MPKSPVRMITSVYSARLFDMIVKYRPDLYYLQVERCFEPSKSRKKVKWIQKKFITSSLVSIESRVQRMIREVKEIAESKKLAGMMSANFSSSFAFICTKFLPISTKRLLFSLLDLDDWHNKS